MPPTTPLHRDEVTEQDGWTRTGVVVEAPREPAQTLWYAARLPEGWKLSSASDAFVLIPLHKAMRAGGSLHVEGEVSPSLLANLEEYQQVLACWHPRRFRQVEIVPEREAEQPPGEKGALVAFSGGVDSCFSAYRHAKGLAGRRTQTLRAGVMVRGFDMPADEEEGFAAAADKAEAQLATIGLPLVRMATNVRVVEHAWDSTVGAGIASCLHLLQPNARVAIIPASVPYDLPIRWGSDPLTDPLLSSESLPVIHDGGGFTRPEKIQAISEWPAAMEALRVCWINPVRDRNCGKCGKCIRTILVFRALGLGLPPCFDEDVTDAEIRAMGRIDHLTQPFQRMVLDVIDERGLTGSWVRPTRSVYYRSRRRDLTDLAVDHARRRLRRVAPGRGRG